MRPVLFALVFCAASFYSGSEAFADEDEGYGKSDWPLSLVKRPIVPAKGMLQVQGDTLRMNLSKGSAFEPISLAPDFFYGVKKGWTVGLTHDTGICFTGVDGGCAKAYNDVGVELQMSLMGRGSFQLAATGGASLASVSDPFVAGLNFGFLSRLRIGKVAVDARPRIYVGLAGRDSQADLLDIPVDVNYQLNQQTAVGVETGVSAVLDDPGGTNRIPFGLAALFAVNEKIDFGLALRLTNMAGSDGGIDGREFVGRFGLRL